MILRMLKKYGDHRFRVRVREGSPIVTSNVDDNGDIEAGVYEVQGEDLPLKEIYQCDEDDLTKLCIRDLAAGEKKKAATVITPTSTHSSRHRSSSDVWSAAAWRRLTV
jgi:hypothetical protein